MFDPVTAQLLRSAPELPGLDPDSIPQLLTMHYAELASARLTSTSGGETSLTDSGWSLEKIADTYELITSVHSEGEVRRASAFVAATAQQILSKRETSHPIGLPPWNITRERVDPAIASALLFLAAEQYADANEAAAMIVTSRAGQPYVATILSENIRDLARGHLRSIIERANRWRVEQSLAIALQERALLALLEALVTGVELLAAKMLAIDAPLSSTGHFDTARYAFQRVLELSSSSNQTYIGSLGGDLYTSYPGPRHLASLLLSAHDGIYNSSLAALSPPDGADPTFWRKWLTFRADKCPFIWPNHRNAIEVEFHQTGKSAVMVLPTGAGKTTVSALKIAGVLARGKKVIFLAPTHALVEQLTEDLRETFPQDLLGSDISSDFDLSSLIAFHEVEVMTPEACLAMLSFAPTAFADVGLMVFDECHLLSPEAGKIRRSLDSMLCLLAFSRVAPDADMLFLSAMLKNGKEFADWIEDLTGRECVSVELLWKPSRQARGVVIYNKEDTVSLMEKASRIQREINKKKGRKAKNLREPAKKELLAYPFAVWGLQHNWLSADKEHCLITPILMSPVQLSGAISKNSLYLTPNANQVAAKIAIAAARNRLKSIVFVNTKADAVSTAKQIAFEVGGEIDVSEDEQERWNALANELGDLKHSVLAKAAAAVPHNASMLRLERDLAERLFRRPDGATVIVATPTLAQGLNLPAQLAILAGDKRAKADGGGREKLEAHEILNAAARAGRAGHLANGIVLLIPEPIIKFSEDKPLEKSAVEKLQSVLPEDDRCVNIKDPLEVVLDRLMKGQTGDRDVRYLINRMAALQEVTGAEVPTSLFNLDRSLAAYIARQKAEEADFQEKVAILKSSITNSAEASEDGNISVLASRSGLPTEMLLRLRERLQYGIGSLPTTIKEWVIWTFKWLSDDDSARSLLLYDIQGSILAASGRGKKDNLTPEAMAGILPAVLAWISGKTIAEIETLLGGSPNGDQEPLRVCPRARELVSTVVPRGLSFTVGLIAHVVELLDPFEQQPDLNRNVVENMPAAVRRGFDTPEKLLFASENIWILSRVQAHKIYAERHHT
jgi:hypothetical protein